MADSEAPPHEPETSSEKSHSVNRSKRKTEAAARASVEIKRSRPVSTACHECKRRKIKCNGHVPCRRCRNLSLTCIYAQKVTSISLKDASDFQQLSATVSSLDQELERVKSDLARLKDERQTANAADALLTVHNAAPALLDTWGPAPLSSNQAASRTGHAIEQFHGPTSSIYGFNVAKSSLQIMGINHDPVEESDVPTQFLRPHSDGVGPGRPIGHIAGGPIWTLAYSDAVRLARLYDEECGLMYPITAIEPIMAHIDWLYDLSGSGHRDLSSFNSAERDLTDITKLTIAIGLLLEGDGKSEMAQRLYESMESTISAKILSSPSIHSLILLVLSATFLFHSDEEGQAWRLIGMSARLCYEMGLHRRESLLKNFENPDDLRNAIHSFWIIYGLDRRWSFGTGMPFAIQDADIDPLLPEPDDSNVYLKHITRCNKIMSKVWSFNLSYDPTKEFYPTEIDFQIQKWYQELPATLKYERDTPPDGENTPRAMRKLRVLVALRANLATIQIYRPILHSATSTLHNIRHAHRAVSVAKETISLLIHVNQTSNLYATQQVLYNYFLIQALAVIFLATSHAPAEFLNQTRREFYGALGLIRGFGENSYISKRLWSTIRDLKDLREKIGALGHGRRFSATRAVGPDGADQRGQNQRQPPRQDSGEGVFFPSPCTTGAADFPPFQASASSTAAVGQQMSSELVRLFERLGQGHQARRQSSSTESHPHTVDGDPEALRRQSYVNDDAAGSIKGDDLPAMSERSPVAGMGRNVIGHNEEQNMFSRIWAELL